MIHYLESRGPVGRRNTSLAARERLLLAWRLALEEVASRWDALYAGEEDPPWLDEDWDIDQQERIGRAIREGDVEGCFEAIGVWKRAWGRLNESDLALGCVTPPVCP